MTPGESHNEWYQYYCSNICPFNIIKLKLNNINLLIYAVEIVFETIFHGNGRNMTYEKNFFFKKRTLYLIFFFLFIYLFIHLFIYLFDSI